MATAGSIILGTYVNTGGLKKGLLSISSQLAVVGLAANTLQSAASGLVSIFSKPITAAAEFEKLSASYEVLTGSADVAKATLAELQKFGAETTFDMPELAESGKKLIAFGFSAEEVTTHLKRLGELSAGLDIPLNELADIYGKNKVQGKIQAEDINQLTGRGIPIIAELAKQFGVSESGVRDLVSSGKVQFSHLEKAIENLTSNGGKFEGMMQKQSQTMSGIWGKTLDALGMRSMEFGTFLVDAFRLKDALNLFNNFMDSSEGLFESYMQNLKASIDFAMPVFEQLANVAIARFNSIVDTGKWLFDSFASFWNSSGGPTFTQMRDFIFDALVVCEFAFTNFWQILQLGATNGLLSVVSFSAQIAHQFTTVIPATLDWFGKHWDLVIGWVVHEGTGRFSNFFNNLISMFANLPSLISGATDWNEIWKPFESIAMEKVVAMPKIPERVKEELEKQLELSASVQSASLNNSLGDLMNKRRAEMFGTTALAAPTAAAPAAKKADTGVAKALAETPDFKLLSASARGSSAAQESLLRHQMRGQGPATDPAKIQREQLEIAKREEKRQKNIERYMRRMAGESENLVVNIS